MPEPCLSLGEYDGLREADGVAATRPAVSGRARFSDPTCPRNTSGVSPSPERGRRRWSVHNIVVRRDEPSEQSVEIPGDSPATIKKRRSDGEVGVCSVPALRQFQCYSQGVERC